MGPAPPPASDDWVGLTPEPLPVEGALLWAGHPSCGAAVLFTGNVRDHSPGRAGVTELAYEAFEEEAVPRMAAIVAEARRRWPGIGRVVMLHRTGTLKVGEPAVVVVASAPHRASAFDAARYCIDTLKATVPVWKREKWADGEDWSDASTPIDQLSGTGEVLGLR